MPKGLPKDQVDRLRRILLERIIPVYGNEANAARALGVSSSTINRVIHGQGGSVDLLRRVAKLLGEKSEADIMGARVSYARMGDLPGFAQALEEAREIAGDYEPEIWNTVGSAHIDPMPPCVTVATLLKAAEMADAAARATTQTSQAIIKIPSRRPGPKSEAPRARLRLVPEKGHKKDPTPTGR